MRYCNNMAHTFKERNDNLKELGFSDYEDYRGSELWNDIKKELKR